MSDALTRNAKRRVAPRRFAQSTSRLVAFALYRIGLAGSRELFFSALKKGPNLRFCVICAVANETSVADAFQIRNPVSLLWRHATAALALHFDP